MHSTDTILITLGILFLIGLVTETLGRRTRLPRVTLLIIFGFLISPTVLNILPITVEKWFPLITDMALAMVGFLIGGKLTLKSLHKTGKAVLWISIAEVIATTLLVFIGLIIIGVRFDIAILLAGIASATAPAAIIDVLHETKAKGTFAQTLLGIVAIDDAWALILFSLLFIIAHAFHGHGFSSTLLLKCLWETIGAILLGTLLGIPMAFLTGHIKKGEPTLVEALGIVFICCGIALWLKVSFLLAAMTLGIVVTNFAHHHLRPFHAIEHVEQPFMILFFILAGVSLHIDALYAAGFIAMAYIILRILGRIIGSWVGGIISNASPTIRRWMGLALLPQAGVAIGMALVATETFPSTSDIILPVVLGATVIFELIGPLMTKLSLHLAKETQS